MENKQCPACGNYFSTNKRTKIYCGCSRACLVCKKEFPVGQIEFKFGKI